MSERDLSIRNADIIVLTDGVLHHNVDRNVRGQ